MPQLNIWQWAERFRKLSRGVTARPGRYSTSLAPYQREPQESFTAIEVQTVVLYWGKRLGKTEIIQNLHGYTIHFNPRNILHVMPTLESAKKWSKQFFMPMVRACAVLIGRLKEPRAKDANNTILSKEFPGGTISAIGANSPSGFRQVQAPVVTCDEIDAMENGNEGDPVTLAFGRAENYPDSIQVVSSTATRVFSISPNATSEDAQKEIGSRIHAWWLKSDQRKWFCPCPKCGHFQVLMWAQFKWETKEDGTRNLADSWYECENIDCQEHWTDSMRFDAVLNGEWRATANFTGVRGYWLNGLNSTFPPKKGYKNKHHQFAAEFWDAYTSGEAARTAWKNTFLCEPEVEEGDKLDAAPIIARQEIYHPNELPDGIAVLVAKVDVQQDRLEAEVEGFGPDEESWGVEVMRISGNPERGEVWRDLISRLSYPYQRKDGTRLKVNAVGVDVGYKAGVVRKFIKTCGLPRVYALYGSSGIHSELVRQSYKKMYRTFLYSVNVDAAKDMIFARLKITDHGPRYMHFPVGHGYDKEYFHQLCAEEARIRYVKGFPKRFYEKIRERNEALDLKVYGLGVLDILRPNLGKIAERHKFKPEPVQSVKRDYIVRVDDPPPKELPPPIPPGQRRRRRYKMGGFSANKLLGW